jgi:transporter family protein
MALQAFLFALLTAVFWGVATVLDKLALAKLQPIVGVLIRSVAISVVALAAAGATMRERVWEGWGDIDARTWFFIIASGMCSGLIGQWTYYKALKYAEASRIVPIVGGYPLVAFILAVLVLGESITAQKLCGAALVVAGIVLLR